MNSAARLPSGRRASSASIATGTAGEAGATSSARAPSAPGVSEGLDVLHVDMDCFFAAVEVLDDPSLNGRPVIVGGTGTRGVVAACSYEARSTGVRSAMPMAEARRRCPSAVVLAGRHDRYGEVSSELHSIFHEFTPVVEPIALDEAFLDVSGSHRLFGTSFEIAHSIRHRVRDVLHLDCSVGVARTKLIAKLASRAAKPTASPEGPRPGPGVVVVRMEDEIEFLHPRPVSDLWGVGPRTAERLNRYGIHTIADLASLDQAAVTRLVGRAAGTQLFALAAAEDDRPVVADRALKSVGHEETFATDHYEAGSLQSELVRLSDSVGDRMRAAEVVGRTVTLKVRFGDFSTITRSHSLKGSLLSSSEISRVATALLAGVDVSPGVRLIGVSVSSLEPREAASGRQLELLDPNVTSAVARGDVDAAVGAIRDRYGAGAVGPAAVVGPTGLRVKRLGDAQWGPAEPTAPDSAD